MLRQFAAVLTLAVTLAATPAYAADTTGQPGRGGDGHCPIPGLATDPDCVREGAQTLTKSSRDEFPACRNGRAGQPMPPGCRKTVKTEGKCNDSKCRSEFPGNRQGTGGRPPIAPKK